VGTVRRLGLGPAFLAKNETSPKNFAQDKNALAYFSSTIATKKKKKGFVRLTAELQKKFSKNKYYS
jgi:hypothetical protein